jgi:hypothetical protein
MAEGNAPLPQLLARSTTFGVLLEAVPHAWKNIQVHWHTEPGYFVRKNDAITSEDFRATDCNIDRR